MLIRRRVSNSQLSILSPSFVILKLSFCFLLFVCFFLQATIKQGDLLLNRIQKLSRVINMQPRRTAFSTFSCLRDERMATTVPSYLCFCKQCISQMQTFTFQKIKPFLWDGVLFEVNFRLIFFSFFVDGREESQGSDMMPIYPIISRSSNLPRHPPRDHLVLAFSSLDLPGFVNLCSQGTKALSPLKFDQTNIFNTEVKMLKVENITGYLVWF